MGGIGKLAASLKTALVLGVLALSAIGRAEGPQIMNLGNGTEPKDLDPHLITGVPEHRITQNLFEPLVSKDPKTLAQIPGAAERWTVSKDGKVYTFYLRKDGKWSNGEPVTAQDFAYSWVRLLDPKTASEYAYQGYYLLNGKAFNEGKIKDASQVGVKVLDTYTVQATLENPTPFFLGLLYHHSLYPVPRKVIEKYGAQWTRAGNMVSNGAFMLDDWQINKVVRVKKNPHYFDAAKVILAGVNFYPTENLDTEEKMFRSKQLHATYEVPLEKIPYWQADKSGVYQANPYLGTYFYRLNVIKPPLNDVRVRRALSLGLDRGKIIKYVTKAGQMPSIAFTPPNTAGYTAQTALPKDASRLAEAKKLLADAGFPDGKGFPSLEILYNTAESHKVIAEAVQQMWKQNLGISVTLINQEWKVYLNTQRTLGYQVSRSAWIGDYNDPNTFLDMWVTNGGNNNTGWANKKYDELIEQAAKEQNQKKRYAIFQKAEALVMEEAPIIPIYTYVRTYLRSTEVTGMYPNIEDIIPLKYASLNGRSITQK